jgi:hypothetical protein
MNRLTLNKRSNQLQEVLLSLVMVSFFLPTRWNGFVMMLLIIFGISGLFWRPVEWRRLISLLPFLGLFSWMLVGLSYSEDVTRGWKLIERNLSMLLLPLAVLSFKPFAQHSWNRLLKVFTLSGIIAAFVCLGIAGFHSYQAGSIYTVPNNTHFLYNRFMHHQLTDPIGMHAVYFSLFLAVGGVWMLQQWLIKQGNRFLLLVGIFFVVMMLYLMKSATISFGVGLVTIGMMVMHYRSKWKKHPWIKWGVISISILLIAGMTLAVRNKLEHFSLRYDIQNEHMSALAIRLSLWECGTEAYWNHPLIGAGTGAGQTELRRVYAEKGFSIGTKNDFNAHNMFLEYGISHGVIAVVFFLSIFWMSWRTAWRKRNLLWLALITLFFLFSLTESTMRTQKGLFFFVLFTSLYFLQANQVEQSKS